MGLFPSASSSTTGCPKGQTWIHFYLHFILTTLLITETTKVSQLLDFVLLADDTIRLCFMSMSLLEDLEVLVN